MKHTPWLERKFFFDFPVTHFPFYLERLRGSYPRIQAMADGQDDATLSRKIGTAWSFKEHLGHLTDLEELHEQRLKDYLQGKEELQAADMSNKKTEEAHHNDRPVQELLQDFQRVRNGFVKRLEGLDEKMVARAALHPRLKVPMRLVDMVYFVTEHDDHHVLLMRNILENR